MTPHPAYPSTAQLSAEARAERLAAAAHEINRQAGWIVVEAIGRLKALPLRDAPSLASAGDWADVLAALDSCVPDLRRSGDLDRWARERVEDGR